MMNVTHAPAPSDWKRLGSYLRNARADLGISQEFTGLWLRVGHRTIARIEDGSHQPSAAVLAALETALGLPPGSSFEVLARSQRPRQSSTLMDPTQVPTACGHSPTCD